MIIVKTFDTCLT